MMKNGYVRCERCRTELPKSMIEGAIEPWYRIKKIVEMDGKERGRSVYLCAQCTYDFNEWLYKEDLRPVYVVGKEDFLHENFKTKQTHLPEVKECKDCVLNGIYNNYCAVCGSDNREVKK